MSRLASAIFRSAFFTGVCVALVPRAHAQLVSASAASLALGDNYTALARGFNAVNWNPAGLGMPDSPVMSFGFAGRGAAGTDPISLSDLSKYGGVTVPNAVLASWLSRVQAQGGQKVDAEGAGSFALSIGSFAFQLSTSAYERGKLSPDAVEVLLYGNAGQSGTPRTMSLKGSRTEAAVTTTAAASFGQSIDIGMGPLTQHIALGATVKYIVGNALLLGEDAGSQLDANPLALNVQFPIIQSDTALNGMPQRGRRGVGLRSVLGRRDDSEFDQHVQVGRESDVLPSRRSDLQRLGRASDELRRNIDVRRARFAARSRHRVRRRGRRDALQAVAQRRRLDEGTSLPHRDGRCAPEPR
jgi:hypothetical protein